MFFAQVSTVYSSTAKIEAVGFSETSVPIAQTTCLYVGGRVILVLIVVETSNIAKKKRKRKEERKEQQRVGPSVK
jgi:hypothetical protein